MRILLIVLVMLLWVSRGDARERPTTPLSSC